MKAIIPVAGAGTMLRPHTHTQPKALIPVAGRPILSHIIEVLRKAGIEDFIFVIGYLREKIQEYVEDNYKGKISYSFVVQEPRRGLGQAIWLCKDQVLASGQELIIALGDTIIDADLHAILAHDGSLVCVQEVDTPGHFGVVAVDDNKVIRTLVEKPSIPKSNLALVGFYKIKEVELLFNSLGYLIENNVQTRGQYTLTDGLMQMVHSGAKIQIYKVKNWYDCGQKDALLETNRILLNLYKPAITHHSFHNSVIIPPVFIPEHCTIRNSIVGPFVALAEHAVITDSIVQNTILGAYSKLENIVLRHSIIGNDTTLLGRWQSINIGDNTEIDFNL